MPFIKAGRNDAPCRRSVAPVNIPMWLNKRARLDEVEALLPHILGSFLPSLAGGLGGFSLPSFLAR